jgi:hypothetical protein
MKRRLTWMRDAWYYAEFAWEIFRALMVGADLVAIERRDGPKSLTLRFTARDELGERRVSTACRGPEFHAGFSYTRGGGRNYGFTDENG